MSESNQFFKKFDSLLSSRVPNNILIMITFSTDSPLCMTHGIGVYLFPLILEKKELPSTLYLDWNKPDEKKMVSDKPFWSTPPQHAHMTDCYCVYVDFPQDRCTPYIAYKEGVKNGYQLVSNNIHIVHDSHGLVTLYTGKLRWKNKITDLIPEKDINGVHKKIIEIKSADGMRSYGHFVVVTVDNGPKKVVDSWCEEGFVGMMNHIFNGAGEPYMTDP